VSSLQTIRRLYMEEGVDYLNASSKTCQDVVLQMISASSLKQHVTLKGGVVMQHLSKDIRRATQDIDFDFIRYSLSDDMIRSFIQRLNEASGSFVIAIKEPIEPLKHQDYQGKRLHIQISDQQGTVIDTKLDIGVHKDLQIEQEDYPAYQH
jgi:predicted nucleotidyltransferase component of viral defense system